MTARRSRNALPGAGSVASHGVEEFSFLSHPQPKRSKLVTAEIATIAQVARFSRCPICLTGDPVSREHVPPESVGGEVLTYTCMRCNNDIASRFESRLADYAHSRVRYASMDFPDLKGRRTVGELSVRFTPGGEFVIAPHHFPDEVAEELERGSKFSLSFTPPDPVLMRIALLKHVYLAACTLTRNLDLGVLGRQARSELVAARDAPRGQAVSPGPLASALRYTLRDPDKDFPAVALTAFYDEESMSTPEFVIVLAGRIAVRWPFGGLYTVVDESGGRTFYPMSRALPAA